MLRRFLYLDSVALGEYVASIEGGLSSQSTRRSLRSGQAEAGLDAKLVAAKASRASEEEDTRVLADTDEARFDRLLAAAQADPDALGWIEVMQPDSDFAEAQVGTMVSWECDVYVPQIIRALAAGGEGLAAIEMMQSLLPFAAALGLDTDGLPEATQANAMAGMIATMKSKMIAVGEDDDTDWRVSGPLLSESLRSELDGRALVVGKVAKIVRAGHWKPFLSFPGMNLLSREQRRSADRTAPPPGKEDEYLHGPSLMLDILAIYRRGDDARVIDSASRR